MGRDICAITRVARTAVEEKNYNYFVFAGPPNFFRKRYAIKNYIWS